MCTMEIIELASLPTHYMTQYFTVHKDDGPAVHYVRHTKPSYWIHGECLPVYNPLDFEQYKEARFGNNRT